MNKSSLTKKIILRLVGIIFCFGILACLIVVKYSYEVISKSEKDNLLLRSRSESKQIGLILEKTSLFAKMMATRTRVTEYLLLPTEFKKEELTSIFDSYQKDYQYYLSIYLMDINGNVKVSTDRSFLNNNYSFRPYFYNALQGKTHVQAAIGKTTNALGLYFSHPVFDPENRIIGVIAVKMDPSIILRSLQENNQSQKDGLTHMITDKNGVILISTKEKRVLKSLGPLDDFEKQRAKNDETYGQIEIQSLQYEKPQQNIRQGNYPSAVEIEDSQDGEKELISITAITPYPFFLVEEYGMNQVYSNIFGIVIILGAAIFLCALTAATFSGLTIAKSLSPLDQLKQSANYISQGKFDKKIEIKTGDELEQLGLVLDQMRQNLKSLYDDLDTKVREKTDILEKQIIELEKTKGAMTNLLEDINEEKKLSEEQTINLQKFQLAVSQAHDHIVITDPEGIVIFANKAVENIIGFANKEVIGKKAGNKKLWGGLMEDNVYSNFWQTIKTKRQTFVGEFKNRRKNGQEYIAEAHVSPIINREGKVIFFVGIERDITKIKEVDRMKTEFISLASHQLRTPLSAMKWFLEMLLAGDAGQLNQEQKEFVINIEQSNERMINLVNALLNVSRIESGRIIIDPSATDLKKLVEEVIKELSVKLSEKKQKIITSIHPSLPLILLDKKLIHEAYLNLLTNAIKYSPESAEIYIFVSKKGQEILTQVKDNGYGVPPLEQEHIFRKFFRATNAINLEADGNGLGLYLVKSIVESSGGKVWFKSEEKKGSSFYFTIPIAGMKKKAGEVSIS